MITQLWYVNECGNPECFSVGENNVKEITAGWARGEGDKCVWAIHFLNGDYIQIFNPTKIMNKNKIDGKTGGGE